MRKGIKTKAFAIFLSWLMIVAHSIIPHNHIEKDISDYAPNLKQCIHHHEEGGSSGIFHGQCEDINSCHISNFLFPIFNQDNLIIQCSRDINVYSAFLTGHIIFDTAQDFIIDNFYGSVSLRAPPAT